MMRIMLDKIASAAKCSEIENEVYVSDSITAREGYVVAVKVLNDKAVYNVLENEQGRMTRVKSGDIIAGVLGHRRALMGYAGDVPDIINTGDRLNILNMGGVMGRCTSYAPDVGKPFEVEVLGAVLHFPYFGQRKGVPLCISGSGNETDQSAACCVPVIAVLGTSMNAGKTVAACEIIHKLTRKGKKIAAAKVTGVALQRDVLNMKDHGACEALSFVDTGVVSTDTENSASSAREIISRLSMHRPDAIVLEFGDGILGEYGVKSILEGSSIVSAISSVVLCANDPVSAWGGVKLLTETFNMNVTAITGPATDNEVGKSFIRESLGINPANAMNEPEELAGFVMEKVFENEQ